jgi:uncharacterized repeat protein (TIGR04076 family)
MLRYALRDSFNWFCDLVGLMKKERNLDDTFQLYDLKIIIEEIKGQCTCDHSIGQYFELKGGKLSLPDGQSFCLYALQSVIPLLPAKQRRNHPNDWMETDARVICPDPLCGVVLLIERSATRTLHHADVSAVTLARDEVCTRDRMRDEG